MMGNASIGGTGMKLGWKNEQKSCIRDLHNWNGSAQLRGGGVILKNKENDVFLTYEGVIGSS